VRPVPLYSLVNRRQRRQQARARAVTRRLSRSGLGCAAAGLALVVLWVLAVGLGYAELTAGLPSIHYLPQLLDPVGGPLLQPTRLYDRSGTQVIYSLEIPGIPRRYVYLDPNRAEHFSPELVRAVVGVLEPGFWQSAGVSLGHLRSAEPATIAERLALNLLLWQEPPGLRRALRMRLLAAQMVAVFGRAQVLEWYLNSAYFGRLAYGAGSAARLYLDRPVEALSLAESAVIVAAHQAPALNPIDAPLAARERQQQVLELLRARGVITAAELERAAAQAVPFMESVPESASLVPAFARLAVDQLADRFGRERLERGGLRVITTLDYNLQIELNCLMRVQLLRLHGQEGDAVTRPDGSPCQAARLLPTLPPGAAALPEDLAASGVVLDPRTGEVLALSGDTTLQGEGEKILPHAPGSLLAPLAAVAGFARGYGPASLVWDIPAGLSEEPEDGAQQAPTGSFHGPVRLRMALANDYLTPLAQMVEQVGEQNVWQLLETLGLEGLAESAAEELSPGQLLYGGGSASPVDLAQAYAIIAAQGFNSGQRQGIGGEIKPYTALYVEAMTGAEALGEGQVILDARQPESQAVLSAPLAYLIHHVLSDASARWPSLGYPNLLEIGRPAGARVGRVRDGSQTWTVGYTPQRLALVWVGLPEAQPPAQPLDERLSAGIWHALMQYMSAGAPPEDWREPPGIARVEVCDPSGQLPTPACPNVVSEVFLKGNEPNAYDSLYQVVEINRETGRLATVFTPPALVEEKVFLVAPPEARAWVLSAGLPLPPEDYDAIQPLQPSPEVRIDSPASFAYVSGKVNIRGTAAGEDFRFFQLQAGQGLNPRDWLIITPESEGQSPVQDSVLGVWDTSGLEGLYAIRLMVVRQNQQVETAVIQVTVDNTAPQARIDYPLPGQTVELDRQQSITFRAEVTDAVGISRVVWQVDGKIVGESLQAPYVFTWQPRPGRHTLKIEAFDPAGNRGESETVSFQVQ